MTKQVNVIVHHNDPDGWMSAHIVNNYIMRQGNPEAKTLFIEANYGYKQIGKKAKDYFVAEKGDENCLYVVDFSFSSADFEELEDTELKTLVWVDHHKTAIGTFEEPGDCMKIVESSDFRYKHCLVRHTPMYVKPDLKRAGCEIAWDAFMGDQVMNKAIDLTGSYDSWREEECGDEYLNTVIPFFYGLQTIEMDPRYAVIQFPNVIGECSDFFMHKTTGSTEPSNIVKVNDILFDGRILFGDYQRRWAIYRKTNGYNITLTNGWKAYCMLTPEWGSLMFGDEIKKNDLCIAIAYLPGTKRWSLRMYSANPKVDCGKYCAELQPSTPVDPKGGGGHAGAAGAKVQFVQPYLKP